MKIVGLQKTTLIDYPGEVACTIFLFGCNFRCGFCYNSELVLKEMGRGFSEKEILDFLKERKGKLDAVCISGGEPLMTLDLDFVRKIKNLGYKIKIDTNGSFPEVLEKLIDEKLIDAVAMDIKAPKEKYLEVVAAKVDLTKIEKSMSLISSLDNYEFRTTVVEKYHGVDEMVSLARWLNEVCQKKPRKFSLQGFKVQGNLIDPDFLKEKNVSEKYLNNLKTSIQDFFETVEVKV